MIEHPIPPLYNKKSKILILGSFPSIKSREAQFFYGHPSNRFWKVIAGVYGAEVPEAIEQKKHLLLSNNIAVWDSIASCDIEGSADSSIKNVTANNISVILDNCNIRKIYVNGKTSQKIYNKYIKPMTEREAVYLPSTSAANAKYSVEKLVDEWNVLKNV